MPALGFGLAPAFERRVSGPAEGVEFDFYISSAGDDDNDGLTPEAPMASLAHAIAVSSSGDSIGLEVGQYHMRGAQAFVEVDRELGAYGVGDNPVIDARQELTGKTWTQRAGTIHCWETTVTFRDATANNGANSNSNTYHLWFPGDVHGTWKVGGADIAANVAAVDAAAGAYTVYRTGSTVQDPRSDTNATGYTFVICMPDDSDPNGQRVTISDRRAIWYFGPYLSSDITCVGEMGKDATSTPQSYPFATFRNHKRLHTSQHGHVGPVNVEGTYTAIGYGVPGAIGAWAPMANGGGLNVFTTNDLTAHDLTIGHLILSNYAQGLYGHGAGNQLYNNITVERIDLTNGGACAQFDYATGRIHAIKGVVTIGEVNGTDVNIVLNGAADFVLNGGNVTFDARNKQPTVVVFTTDDATETTINGLSWTFPVARNPNGGQWNCLCQRLNSSGGAVPKLTLNDCHDLSAAANQGALFRSGTYAWLVDLYLTGGTTIGSLLDQATGTNYPNKLFVEAGCIFGMGDRTGPQIEAALIAAGKTSGVDFAISGDTTIVNRAGAVLSAPGWK